jgi:hypothetical protein
MGNGYASSILHLKERGGLRDSTSRNRIWFGFVEMNCLEGNKSKVPMQPVIFEPQSITILLQPNFILHPNFNFLHLKEMQSGMHI